MRRPHHTLTPTHVQAHAAHRLQKHLCLKDHGPKYRADILWLVLLYAASRIISLAAACASLRDAPSDTAAHDALLATLPNYAELQRRLNRALQGDLPYALRRRRQPMAVDVTSQCLSDRLIGELIELQSEIAAWSDKTNAKQRGVDWQFRIDNARVKLKRLYPKIKA